MGMVQAARGSQLHAWEHSDSLEELALTGGVAHLNAASPVDVTKVLRSEDGHSFHAVV